MTDSSTKRHESGTVLTTENSLFYHEFHEGNEDNTLSQCILCGDAYKATLLLEKRTDLRYIQQFIGH